MSDFKTVIKMYGHSAETANLTVMTDNGAGQLCLNGQVIAGSQIDYDLGMFSIPKAVLEASCEVPEYDSVKIIPDERQDITYTPVGQKETQGVIHITDQARCSAVSSAETEDIELDISTGLYDFNVLEGKSLPRMAILNSWVFEINKQKVYEKNGILYRNIDYNNGNGEVVGRLDPFSGVVSIEYAGLKSQSIKILSGIYTTCDLEIKQFYGRTISNPIKPRSFTVYANNGSGVAVGQAGDNGQITGDLGGHIDTEIGFYSITSDKLIAPDTLRYNAVVQSNVPLDSSIIGIDAVRLPPDGRVPIFRRGDMIVIGNRQKEKIGSAFTGGQIVKLSRDDLERVCIVDAEGKNINANLYTVDYGKGEITFSDNLNLSEYIMPLTAHHSQEEENRVIHVDINGTLKLQFPVARDYPIENTFIASALIPKEKDLLVRATKPFSQQAWNKVWSDVRETDEILAQLNVKDYPITLTSKGAITERWLLLFTSDSQFNLFGESLGLVATGDRLTDLAPNNPATDAPYFNLPAAAFGGGWESKNCVRFNTFGTPMPIWVLRAVQPSAEKQKGKDGFTLCLRGNTVETEGV